MNLNQIRAFVAVLDHGSLSAAAAHLGVSTANLSDHIQRLEQANDVVLFARSARGMLPTHAGALFATHARRMLEVVRATEVSLGNIGSVQAGSFSVGMLRNGGYYLTRRMVELFRQSNSQAQLRFLGRNSYHVADLVRAGELELGFVVLPINSEGLNVTPLFDDEVVIAGSSRLTPELGEEVTLRQLSELDLVLYDVEDGVLDPTRRQLEARLNQASISLTPTVEVQYVETAFDIIRRTGGVVLVASQVLKALDPGGTMRHASLSEPLRDTVAIVTRLGESLSPRLAMFEQYAVSLADELVQKNPRMRRL